jgi:hypothetical protein
MCEYVNIYFSHCCYIIIIIINTFLLRTAYAANAVGKDLDIFAVEPFLSITFTLIKLKLLIIFVHTL